MRRRPCSGATSEPTNRTGYPKKGFRMEVADTEALGGDVRGRTMACSRGFCDTMPDEGRRKRTRALGFKVVTWRGSFISARDGRQPPRSGRDLASRECSRIREMYMGVAHRTGVWSRRRIQRAPWMWERRLWKESRVAGHACATDVRDKRMKYLKDTHFSTLHMPLCAQE